MKTREKEIAAAVDTADIDIDRLDVLNAFVTLRDAGGRIEDIGIVGVANALYTAVRVILGDEATAVVLGDTPRVTEVMIAARACGARLAPEMEGLIKTMNDLVTTAGD